MKKITENIDLKGAGKAAKGTWKEFKEFAMKGNLIDMAIGVIIGGAFGTIVTSLVNDIIMPLISLATGKIDFENMFVALDGGTYATLAEAQAAGGATLNYGSFITYVINFLIVAASIFFFVKMFINPMKKAEEARKAAEAKEAPVTTKECPYCKSTINIEATRCPHCTSELK